MLSLCARCYYRCYKRNTTRFVHLQGFTPVLDTISCQQRAWEFIHFFFLLHPRLHQGYLNGQIHSLQEVGKSLWSFWCGIHKKPPSCRFHDKIHLARSLHPLLKMHPQPHTWLGKLITQTRLKYLTSLENKLFFKETGRSILHANIYRGYNGSLSIY